MKFKEISNFITFHCNKYLKIYFTVKTFAGMDGIVTGWGAIEESGPISQTLQEVVVPILTNSECRATKYPARRITDNMLCAGFKEGQKDSCQVIKYASFSLHLSLPTHFSLFNIYWIYYNIVTIMFSSFTTYTRVHCFV